VGDRRLGGNHEPRGNLGAWQRDRSHAGQAEGFSSDSAFACGEGLVGSEDVV